jgi:hypothetical protein
VRWLARLVLRAAEALFTGVVLFPVMLPALLIVEVLDGIGGVDAKSWEFGQPKIAVAGDPDTQAVALGDHVRRGNRDLWLVWSGTRLAIVAADPVPRVLWQADEAEKHDVAPSSGAIDFSDGSTVNCIPADAELDRLREFDDRP